METNFGTPPCTLDVSVYETMEKISDTISKSRVRIFYKGMNRNRTFISEDFANQLIASLPYTPIKGIFDKDTLDFGDHGNDNSDGRIYGIVPENPNFAWEDHQDIDGVTRQYACCDVYLFNGIYPEANLVPGKSQSMEIYRKTLVGEWRISDIDQKPYYHFLKGCLVGLQALGDEVEPCFEGAAFFSIIKELANYSQKLSKQEGNSIMDKTLFRISDNEKADILFDLINSDWNEAGGWKLTGIVTDVYDDYALYVSTDGYHRVYYTKDGDNITLGETVDVKIVDVTFAEYTALETMKTIGSYEDIKTSYDKMVEDIKNYEIAASEFEVTKTTLETTQEQLNSVTRGFTELEKNLQTTTTEFNEKIQSLENEKVELNNKINDITNENNVLADFKKNIEQEQKKAILAKYEEYLTDTAIDYFQSTMENMSVEDFKKEVCTSAVENDNAIFNKNNGDHLIHKGNGTDHQKVATNGVLALLNKRKNGGNK